MPDIAKFAGVILDLIQDFGFLVRNTRLRPESAAQIGADKIRAIHLSAIILLVFLAAGIRAIPAGEARSFEILFFLVVTLVYYSAIGAVIAVLNMKWTGQTDKSIATSDAMTVILGFNLISLLSALILLVMFREIGFALKQQPVQLGIALLAVLIAGAVMVTRSQLRQFGAAKGLSVVAILTVTALLYIWYIGFSEFR